MRRRLSLGIGVAALVAGLLPAGCFGAGIIGLPDGGVGADTSVHHDGGGPMDATPQKDVTTQHDAFIADVIQGHDAVTRDVGQDVATEHDAAHDSARDAELDVTGHDAAHDSGFDAGHDSGHDAGHDAGQDAGPTCTAACNPKQDCNGTQCLACTPTVINVAQGQAPPLPPGGTGGLKVTCGDVGNGYAGPCPVVVCGEVSYWFFSDGNNDEDLFMVGYYPGTTVYSGPVTITGNRYVDTVTIDTVNQQVTINGQAGATVEPYSFFQ